MLLRLLTALFAHDRGIIHGAYRSEALVEREWMGDRTLLRRMGRQVATTDHETTQS